VRPQDKETFDKLTDVQLVALTIYLEARGEPQQAWIGIVWVILLRVKAKTWMGKSIREVILKPSQFSEYNDDDREYMLALGIAENWQAHFGADRELREAVVIADQVISGKIANPFGRNDVLYFRASTSHPNYESTQKKVAQWGETGFWVDQKKAA
jgi:N-acetylmuramoyl-L-alanine amidase